jgi:hypothetical protein
MTLLHACSPHRHRHSSSTGKPMASWLWLARTTTGHRAEGTFVCMFILKNLYCSLFTPQCNEWTTSVVVLGFGGKSAVLCVQAEDLSRGFRLSPLVGGCGS